MSLLSPLSLPEQFAEHAELVLASVQQTNYQHNSQIDVDGGIYECDCSGFVSFLLLRAAPTHYGMIPKETTEPRPRAFKFCEFFGGLTSTSPGGWHRIHFMQDMRRGDIIAWEFTPIEPHQDTGHCFIVGDTPVLEESGNYRVLAYDSAAKAHAEDSRVVDGVYASGVGSGYIAFEVDDTGAPLTFQFTPGGPFEAHTITVGRLEALPPAS